MEAGHCLDKTSGWELVLIRELVLGFFGDDKCSTFRVVYNYTLMGWISYWHLSGCLHFLLEVACLFYFL